MFVVCLHPLAPQKHPLPSVQAWTGIRNSLQTYLEWWTIKRVWLTLSNIIISSPKPALHCSWNVDFHSRNLLLLEWKARKFRLVLPKSVWKKKKWDQKCGNSDRNINTVIQNYTLVHPGKFASPGKRSKGIWVRAELIHAANPQHHHSQGLLSLPDIPFHSFL